MSNTVRALGALIVATFSGCAAVVLLYQTLAMYEAKLAEASIPEEEVMVMVAARDLYPGIEIGEEDLYAVSIPPSYLPDGVFLHPDHVIQRVPRERILRNDLVRAGRLVDPERGEGLHAIIPRGLRAISVEISDGAALHGLLQPGNYVDLLVTVTPEDGIPLTSTLLQSVFVLGVDGRRASETPDEARRRRGAQRPSVTLLVTAEQAEQVTHAERVGQVWMSLRSDSDLGQVVLTSTSIRDLVRQLRQTSPVRVARHRPPRDPVPPGETTLVINGDEVEVVPVGTDVPVR